MEESCLTLVYATEAFEVRPAQRRVLLHGAAVALGARAFDLLVVLIERRERVVRKDELMALVWPGLVVEENNLTVHIAALRKALGHDTIATVSGQGYRFAATLVDRAGPGPDFAPLIPVKRHNLPAERSSFIGRGPQIDATRQILATHRLATLTGMGGVGKTRIALQVAAQELPRFADGVFFVDLAPVSGAPFVAQAVAAACGLSASDRPADGMRPVHSSLLRALAPRICLLVMDNCEHVLDASAELIDLLLSHCAGLSVLATSREVLALEGEQVLSVPPLALPLADRPEELTDAVLLFAERARAAHAAFTLDGENLRAVTDICRRVDGIPLAIEFAAARAAHLSPQELAERLDGRLELLGGGRRRLGRQQTLVATLDWSHELLSEREQALFRRLAVFPDAFTMRALDALCGALPEGAGVLALMASLVAKSLVAMSPDDAGDTRFRLLEVVRLYALDKLDAAGETAAWRVRHRDAWLAWLEAMPLESLTIDVGCIAGVGREIHHLRSAAQACIAGDRPELLARLTCRLLGFHLTGQGYGNSVQMLERALEHPNLTNAQRVACHTGLAGIHLIANDVAAGLAEADRAVQLAADGVGGFEVAALALRGFARSIQAHAPQEKARLRDDARADARLAVERAATLAPGWAAFCQAWAADVELILGDYEAGAGHAEAAERSCREAVRRSPAARLWILGSVLTKLAVALHLRGETEPALRAAERALAEFVSHSAHPVMADGWKVELAVVFLAGGRRALALELLREGALHMRRNGVDQAPNQFLIVAAVVAHLCGEVARSARLFGAARSAGGADRIVMSFRTPTSMGLYQHYMPLVREAVGAQDGRRLRDEGRAMAIDEAFAYALQTTMRT